MSLSDGEIIKREQQEDTKKKNQERKKVQTLSQRIPSPGRPVLKTHTSSNQAKMKTGNLKPKTIRIEPRPHNIKGSENTEHSHLRHPP